MVVIAGDVPSYYFGRHPHQEVNLHADADQSAICRPFVKRAWRVDRAEDLARFTERAFWTATSGRPGAVLVSVPMDHFSRPVPAASHPLVADPGTPALPAGVADRIATALIGARRPLVYLGGGLRRDSGVRALRALVEHLDIPVAHSLMAKGVLPDDHPLLLGMPGFWGLSETNGYTRDADVILALATRFAETDASSWDGRHTWQIPPARLIQIDIDPAEIGRNFPVEIGAVADVNHAVEAIARAVRDRQATPVSRAGLRERIAAARADLFAGSRERGRSDQFPLRPERILADLRDALPADAVLVTDVGWNKNGVAQCYELPAAGRFITPGGASTMGFGPAAAVGVQIGQPGRTVVALVGDGGMSAQLPAVPLAVEQGAPVIFVVMNNRSHGTISDLQAANFGRSYGCDFTGPDGQPYSPDFAAYGRACGADGYPVASAADLAVALRDAVAARRPAVIDVPMVNEPVPTPGHWNIKDIYRGAFA
jgi:acetolactate synthase-1/2/3 large subunit